MRATKPSVAGPAAPSPTAQRTPNASRSRQPWLRVRPPPRPRRVRVASRPRASVSTDAAPDRRRARSRKIFARDAALAHRRSPSHPPPGTRAEDAGQGGQGREGREARDQGEAAQEALLPRHLPQVRADLDHRAAPAPLPRCTHRPAADAAPAQRRPAVTGVFVSRDSSSEMQVPLNGRPSGYGRCVHVGAPPARSMPRANRMDPRTRIPAPLARAPRTPTRARPREACARGGVMSHARPPRSRRARGRASPASPPRPPRTHRRRGHPRATTRRRGGARGGNRGGSRLGVGARRWRARGVASPRASTLQSAPWSAFVAPVAVRPSPRPPSLIDPRARARPRRCSARDNNTPCSRRSARRRRSSVATMLVPRRAPRRRARTPATAPDASTTATLSKRARSAASPSASPTRAASSDGGAIRARWGVFDAARAIIKSRNRREDDPKRGCAR